MSAPRLQLWAGGPSVSRRTAGEAGGYLLVGGVCTVLDISLLFALVRLAGMHYLAASVISFLAGTLLNYVLCTRYLFSVRRVENRPLEFSAYVGITAIGLGMNTGLLWFFTEQFGWHFLISKLVATSLVVGWNFSGRKLFLHR